MLHILIRFISKSFHDFQAAYDFSFDMLGGLADLLNYVCMISNVLELAMRYISKQAMLFRGIHDVNVKQKTEYDYLMGLIMNLISCIFNVMLQMQYVSMNNWVWIPN